MVEMQCAVGVRFATKAMIKPRRTPERVRRFLLYCPDLTSMLADQCRVHDAQRLDPGNLLTRGYELFT